MKPKWSLIPDALVGHGMLTCRCGRWVLSLAGEDSAWRFWREKNGGDCCSFCRDRKREEYGLERNTQWRWLGTVR